MELHGEIISKHVDQIRINLYDKNQVVDVFYTESHKFDIEKLTDRQKIIFSVRIQSIDYYGLKMGKFWLHEILLPAPPPKDYGRKPKVSFKDLVKKNEFGEYIE